MNEIFDKLILRAIFAAVFCLFLLCYKHIHTLMYPAFRQESINGLQPSKNAANTIHLFSRILGLGIIFVSFNISLSEGIVFALVDLTIKTILSFAFYAIFLYVMESIAIHSLDYEKEIIEQASVPYAVVSMGHSLGAAFVINNILQTSHDSIILFCFLWLFSMVLLGLATKTFFLMSKLDPKRLINQRSLAVSFSYMGFIWGWSILISFALNHEVDNLKAYATSAILKILLSLAILPLFLKGIVWIWNFHELKDNKSQKKEHSSEIKNPLGYGIYEGISFFTGCLLTAVITGQMDFGTFYPVF